MTKEEKNIANSSENTESSETDKILQEWIQQINALSDSILSEKITIKDIIKEVRDFQKNIMNSKIDENDKFEIVNWLNNIDYKKEKEELVLEVQSIVELLKNLVNKNLQALQNEVINHNSQEQEWWRSPEVNEWIKKIKDDFNKKENATNDENTHIVWNHNSQKQKWWRSPESNEWRNLSKDNFKEQFSPENNKREPEWIQEVARIISRRSNLE